MVFKWNRAEKPNISNELRHLKNRSSYSLAGLIGRACQEDNSKSPYLNSPLYSRPVLFIGAFHHQERVLDFQLRGSLPQVPTPSLISFFIFETHNSGKQRFSCCTNEEWIHRSHARLMKISQQGTLFQHLIYVSKNHWLMQHFLHHGQEFCNLDHMTRCI